jgi:hypothetical protein
VQALAEGVGLDGQGLVAVGAVDGEHLLDPVTGHRLRAGGHLGSRAA